MRCLTRTAAYLLCAFVALSIYLATFSQGASAQEEVNCNNAIMTIQGAEPSPFVLPRDAGQTMKVEPNSVLLITLTGEEGTTFRDPEVAVGVVAGGITLQSVTRSMGSGLVTGDTLEPVPVNLQDQLPPGMQGLYEVQGTLRDASGEICTVDFLLQVGHFCVATSAATAVTSVSSIGAIASVIPAMKFMILPTIQRRRSRGWRRWIPVPDLKWTIITTVLGAVAGLVTTTFFFQQTAVSPLSFVNGIWGVLGGGGLTFGVAYLGALLTYFMSPEEPDPTPSAVEGDTVDMGDEVEVDTGDAGSAGGAWDAYMDA